jgi:hypothetical protein
MLDAAHDDVDVRDLLLELSQEWGCRECRLVAGRTGWRKRLHRDEIIATKHRRHASSKAAFAEDEDVKAGWHGVVDGLCFESIRRSASLP